MTYLGDIRQDIARLECKFCRPSENQPTPNLATTTITNLAASPKPIPACQDCRDLWDEQCYNDYQAWLSEQPEQDRDVRDSSLDPIREMRKF